jgi:mRNA-degrading endonuclease RelE of RelBE toxin-antitoxin system
MIWQIEVSSRFEKYYLKLSQNNRKRVKTKLRELEDVIKPILHKDVKPLTGDLKSFYRMRIGELRIIFSILDESKTIAVVNLFPRSKGY